MNEHFLIVDERFEDGELNENEREPQIQIERSDGLTCVAFLDEGDTHYATGTTKDYKMHHGPCVVMTERRLNGTQQWGADLGTKQADQIFDWLERLARIGAAYVVDQGLNLNYDEDVEKVEEFIESARD